MYMMLPPSREQSNSDAGPTEVLNSNEIVSSSPVSDHSDTITDPVLLGREVAQEVSAANEEATDDSRRATISYEEALEREIEYQKRTKMIMSQHQGASRLLPMSSQELPPMPSFSGSRKPLLQPPQDRWPPVQQLQHQIPFPNNRWPLRQPQDRPPQRCQPQGQQPPPQLLQNHRPPNYQENPVWCHLCKVKCVTPYNLKFHCQGKKHKANQSKVLGSKMRSSSYG